MKLKRRFSIVATCTSAIFSVAFAALGIVSYSRFISVASVPSNVPNDALRANWFMFTYSGEIFACRTTDFASFSENGLTVYSGEESRVIGNYLTLPWFGAHPHFAGFSEWFETHSDGTSVRSVVVPCWSLVLLTSVLPIIKGSSLLRRRARNRRGQCIRCGYDCRATPDQCPECGRDPHGGGLASEA